MNERLLQFIWQFQYFSKNNLATTDEEPVQIIYQGSYNTNQGPDFSEGKIKISDTTWAGNIELHVNASDWNLHKHTGDNNYNNVVLHVVWNYNEEIKDGSGHTIPALELQSRVSKMLLRRYEDLMNATTFISCESNPT